MLSEVMMQVSLFAVDQYIKPHQLNFAVGNQLLAMVSTSLVNTSWFTGLPMV